MRKYPIAQSKEAPQNEEPLEEVAFEAMTEAIDHLIPLFSTTVRGLLAIHMKNFGFKDREVNAVAGILETPTSDPAEALVYLLREAVALSKKDTKQKYTMGDLQPTVRALAAYENHAASKMPNGHYNSRMFQNIAQQHVALMASMLEGDGDDEYVEFVNPAPSRDRRALNLAARNAGSTLRTSAGRARCWVNPAEYLDALLETHKYIVIEGEKLGAEMALQEAAHHILDWIGLIDIEELLQYDPRSFALIMLAVAHRISKTGYPKGALGCSEKKISSLLKNVFPDTTLYEKEIMRIAELALCGCGDPELMIADVINSPEDTQEKLASLAPCLKLRSPVDLSDLPTPSPFLL
ncbi:MAG TPA: hypothetical protein VJK53_00140 [Candidatus Paceibacterota bacterium]